MTSNFLIVSAFSIPWLVFLTNRVGFKSRHIVIPFLISLVAVYVFILLSVRVLDVELRQQLTAFDLDGDGGFSDFEITPAQQQAEKNVTNDTARAVAPVTGIVFSVIYVSIVFGVWSLILWLASLVRGKLNARA